MPAFGEALRGTTTDRLGDSKERPCPTAAGDHRSWSTCSRCYLLGEEPTLTGQQLADEVGIPFEDLAVSAGARSASPPSAADERGVHHADLEALRLTQRLHEIGLIDPDDESALVRTLGRSFARLAEWQMGLLGNVIDPDTMEVDELREVMDEVTPAVESLQNYVWRRHTLAAASRLLLANAPRSTRRRARTTRARPWASVSPTSSTTPGRAGR